MSSIKTSHRTFLAHMFAAFMVFQGKASMTNLSRYIPVSEKRFRRHFERDFDHAQFNTQLFHKTDILGKEVIAAIDASFIKKSGKKTDGLSWFYNGTAGCMQKGLEISLLALVDIQTNTAYTLEAQQTLDQPDQTRVDSYAVQVLQHAQTLQQLGVQYLTADAYYSKGAFVSKVLDSGMHFIGKLRSDANLKWLYQGAYLGSGRPKKFDGKIDFDQEIQRFDDVGVFEAHFSSQFQTEEFLVGLLSKVFLLDVYFFRKRHFSSTCIWVFWVVFGENPFLFSFGIVGNDQFQRI